MIFRIFGIRENLINYQAMKIIKLPLVCLDERILLAIYVDLRLIDEKNKKIANFFQINRLLLTVFCKLSYIFLIIELNLYAYFTLFWTFCVGFIMLIYSDLS
jgi:hypothetical protein